MNYINLKVVDFDNLPFVEQSQNEGNNNHREKSLFPMLFIIIEI